MLLLEACTQLAVAACRDRCGTSGISGVSAYDMTFGQFVECGIPTTLTAHVEDADLTTGGRWPSVAVSVSRSGQQCGTAVIGLAVLTIA